MPSASHQSNQHAAYRSGYDQQNRAFHGTYCSFAVYILEYAGFFFFFLKDSPHGPQQVVIFFKK
jgi:hypothetical protein